MKYLLTSTIGRKILMALSAFFLIIFLVIHVLINFLSVLSEELFNQASHFMGNNPFIQFFMQPLLLLGVLLHFILGFYLEIQNYKARGAARYNVSKSATNSSWASRNMIYSGGVILLFLGLHLYDFWFPTVYAHYVTHEELNYYGELVQNFESHIRTIIYVIAFIFLGLHLWHGFQSAFKSMGIQSPKYSKFISLVGKAFSIFIPGLFILIAVFHHLKSLIV